MVYNCEYLPPFKCNEKEDIWIMQQFTGLKDKNGKEIYEGDIVKDCASGLYSQVIFGDIEFNKYGKWHPTLGWCSGCVDLDNCKVIGNIYENKELLKEIISSYEMASRKYSRSC